MLLRAVVHAAPKIGARCRLAQLLREQDRGSVLSADCLSAKNSPRPPSATQTRAPTPDRPPRAIPARFGVPAAQNGCPPPLARPPPRRRQKLGAAPPQPLVMVLDRRGWPHPQFWPPTA